MTGEYSVIRERPVLAAPFGCIRKNPFIRQNSGSDRDCSHFE